MAGNFYNTQLNQLPGSRPTRSPSVNPAAGGDIRALLQNIPGYGGASPATYPAQTPRPVSASPIPNTAPGISGAGTTGVAAGIQAGQQGAGLGQPATGGSGTGALDALILQLMQGNRGATGVSGGTPQRPAGASPIPAGVSQATPGRFPVGRTSTSY